MKLFYFVVTSVFTFLTICWLSAGLDAQSIPIKNAGMNPGGPLIHGSPDLPEEWRLETGELENVRAWNSPGDAAIAIGGGATISRKIELPAINPKWLQQSKWKLVLAIDVIGKFSTSDQPAELIATFKEPSVKILASKSFSVSNDAPVSKIAKPSVYASSASKEGPPQRAFDGDPQTHWHSDYGKETAKYPHHLTLDFGEPRILKGATYVPRQGGGNGTLKTASLQISTDGKRWRKAIQGEFKYEKKGQEQRITLERPVKCRAIRLLCKSEIRGADFASCAELIPDLEGGFDGLEIESNEPAPKI